MSAGSNFGALSDALAQPIPPLTSEQISNAQRYVAGRAIDADDLRLLLEMLNIKEAA